jgi:hypothetical protein
MDTELSGFIDGKEVEEGRRREWSMAGLRIYSDRQTFALERPISHAHKYEEFLKASPLHAVKGLSAAAYKRRDKSAPGALAKQG